MKTIKVLTIAGLIILGLIVLSRTVGAEFAKSIKINVPMWEVGGDKSNYMSVYKMQDGKVTCYVVRSENKTLYSGISCIK